MGNAFGKKSDVAAARVAAETFDGGGFVSHGVYPNQPDDYDHKVVHKLIVERKLSPLYKGLADADDLPPGASSPTASDDAGAAPGTSASHAGISPPPAGSSAAHAGTRVGPSTLSGSTSGMPARSSFHSLASAGSAPNTPGLKRSNSYSNSGSAAASAAAAAALRIDPRELYANPVECPICFLYYPPNINYSRCCDHPVCTECFLQMKRSETTNTPVECPFCCEPNFGILYEPPDFAKLQKLSQLQSVGNLDPLVRSAASLPAIGKSPNPLRSRRKKSLSCTDPSVVTCDDIRPDYMRRFLEARYRATSGARRPSVPGTLGGGRRVLIRQPAGASARRSTGGDFNGYLRGMGAELEELMVLEAVRVSLLEEEQRQAQARQQEEMEAAAVARSSQELGPAAAAAATAAASSNVGEAPEPVLPNVDPGDGSGPSRGAGPSASPSNAHDQASPVSAASNGNPLPLQHSADQVGTRAEAKS